MLLLILSVLSSPAKPGSAPASPAGVDTETGGTAGGASGGGGGPVLTASSNAVGRCVGKYLHLMRLLHPITAEVFVGITQVFEYYVSFLGLIF